MIYLFVQSVIPVIPAGWLTFADGAVYKVYDEPVRVWGMTVTDDQQLAGAIMKIGGSFYLWGIIVFMWFKRFGSNWKDVVAFTLLVVILLFRPTGLLGESLGKARA